MTKRACTYGEKILEVSNIHTFYGQIEALRDVSIDIYQGEIVTIIGANGAGKSTLLNSICANPGIRSGTIRYQGENISHLPTHQIMRRDIALVPEGRRVFSQLTIEENLELGGFYQSTTTRRRELEKVFHIFPRLRERKHQRAGTLSGGEQQMLAIGRGLMMKPKLLLLDEPSLGLAPLIISQIFDIIRDIRANGITVLLVEQNAHRVLQIADRGYVLEIGEITQHDSSENLLRSDTIRKAYLGEVV